MPLVINELKKKPLFKRGISINNVYLLSEGILSWMNKAIVFEIIADLHRNGATILLVEQNAQMALSIASRGYVMETGRITTTGTGQELLASEEVRRAYLGG